jgi:hypothetical protein
MPSSSMKEGLGGGVVAEKREDTVGADLDRSLTVLRTPPSRPPSIEEEGDRSGRCQRR